VRFWILFTLLLPFSVRAETLELTGYQTPDGAISTWYGGDTVDVYFATKALMMAEDGGLQTQSLTRPWIAWALNMQLADGKFGRYKRIGTEWRYVNRADADDAVLALWLELLYRQMPLHGAPDSWNTSIRLAELQLQRLYDEERGIYVISDTLPVGLLMDNAEIYASFVRIAVELKRLGRHQASQAYEAKARALASHIVTNFKQADGSFRVSTQIPNGEAFYPDKTAQLFPMLYRIPGESDPRQYQVWMAEHGKEWLRQRHEDYAWGFVAVVALAMHDIGTASCWREASEPMRYSKHWNVMEEVVLQQVKREVKRTNNVGIPCVGKELL
jgi:hypothetical protein